MKSLIIVLSSLFSLNAFCAGRLSLGESLTRLLSTPSGLNALAKMVGAEHLGSLERFRSGLQEGTFTPLLVSKVLEGFYFGHLTKQVMAETVPRSITPLEHFEQISLGAVGIERELEVLRENLFPTRGQISAQSIFQGVPEGDSSLLPLRSFAGQYEIIPENDFFKITLTIRLDGGVDSRVEMVPSETLSEVEARMAVIPQGRGRVIRDGKRDDLVVELHREDGISVTYVYEDMLSPHALSPTGLMKSRVRFMI